MSVLEQQEKLQGQWGRTLRRKPVEVDGGVSGNTELPAKLPSQVPAQLTFRGLAVGEVTTSEPQDIPGLQTCSFLSEFIAGFTNQRPNKDSGLQLLSKTWTTGQHWALMPCGDNSTEVRRHYGLQTRPGPFSQFTECLSFIYQLGVSRHWHLQFHVLM